MWHGSWRVPTLFIKGRLLQAHNPKTFRPVCYGTCPLERLSHLSGPWGSNEWRSSIRSLSGGSSMVAPTDRVSITAWWDKHTPTYCRRLRSCNRIRACWLFRKTLLCCVLIYKKINKKRTRCFSKKIKRHHKMIHSDYKHSFLSRTEQPQSDDSQFTALVIYFKDNYRKILILVYMWTYRECMTCWTSDLWKLSILQRSRCRWMQFKIDFTSILA